MGNSTVHGRPPPGSRMTASVVGAWNPIGVHDPIEQVATGAARHRNPRRACARRTCASMFCGPKTTAMSPEREMDRILPVSNARLRASGLPGRPRNTFVRLPLPARAVDEALAIRREPRRRHGAMPERQPARTLRDGRRDAPLTPWLPTNTAAGDNGDHRARRPSTRAPAPGGGPRRHARSRPAPSAAIQRSSVARSRAVCQRSSGSFARQRPTSRSKWAWHTRLQGRQRGRLDADDGGDQGGTRVADKWPAPGDHLVEDHAKRKDVRSWVDVPVPRSARAPCTGACPGRFHRRSASRLFVGCPDGVVVLRSF